MMLTLPVGLLTRVDGGAVEVEDDVGRVVPWTVSSESFCQVLPVSTLRQRPPLRPAQGGVDDHAAVGRRVRDRRRPCRRGDAADSPGWRSVWANRWSRAANGRLLFGAVEQRPGRAAVHRAEEADALAWCRRRCRSVALAVAGAGDDDRLARVVVPGEDGDRADVEPGGRAEVGQRDRRSGRCGSVVRKLVVFQTPPLAPAT